MRSGETFRRCSLSGTYLHLPAWGIRRSIARLQSTLTRYGLFSKIEPQLYPLIATASLRMVVRSTVQDYIGILFTGADSSGMHTISKTSTPSVNGLSATPSCFSAFCRNSVKAKHSFLRYATCSCLSPHAPFPLSAD